MQEQLYKLQDEIHYLRLREKKIMYLVHLLQSQGYACNQIFERDVKPIDTMRFEEFLAEKEREQAIEDELNARVEISFHSDDSHEPIADGPMLAPVKPECVPCLCFDNMSGYQSSTDEGGEQTNQ